MSWYRMFDPAPKGVFPIEPCDAESWNTNQCGIFATLNEFDGPRRKENLVKIKAWAVDIDEGDKAVQARRIQSAPLLPSLVVETKRGYQAHWYAKPGARAEHWDALVLERLVPYFGADKNARDLCRILRVPGYFHWKDPENPFLIRTAFRLDVAYTERQLAEAFPWVASRERHREHLAEAKKAEFAARRKASPETALESSETLWDAIWALDQREVLSRLSGQPIVNGEVYKFLRTSRGRWNVYVDGRGTGCFVDESGRIGSMSGGGPTIVQWCRWMGKSYVEIIAAMKAAFPELAEIDERNRRAKR